MKLNKTIEKELNKIPDEIKKQYNIDNYTYSKGINGIIIHHPSVINIMFDRSFIIENGKHTIDIQTKKLCVSLWKNTLKMHTTIY